MTFVMSKERIVCQKDLGPKTTDTAAVINSYDPDDSWTPAE
jgi:hypothetical protein